MRDALALLVAAAAPAVPLIFLEQPAIEVLRRLAPLLVGGMPR